MAKCKQCGANAGFLASICPKCSDAEITRAQAITPASQFAAPTVDVIEYILWIATVLGAVIGAFMAAVGVLTANGAPQQAAAAAVGVACAVIPYCLARAVSEMRKI